MTDTPTRIDGQLPPGAPMTSLWRQWWPGSRINWTTPLFVLAALLLAYFVALPIAVIVWQSLRLPDGTFSFDNYLNYLESSRLIEATVNTLIVATVTAIGGVLIAAPLAFGVARTAMRGKNLVRIAVIISFASPPFLMTLAYVLILGPNAGYLNVFLRELLDLNVRSGPFDVFSLWGFIILSLPNTVALIYIIILPGFGNMDPSLEEASRISGAGPIGTIFRITLPIARAAMLAGGLLAFSSALSDFATPHILGIDVLTVSMRRAMVVGPNFEEAATLAAISASASLFVLFLYRRSIRAGLRYQTITGKGFRQGLIDVGPVRHLFTALGISFAVFGAILPYCLLILFSLMATRDGGFGPGNWTLRHYLFVLTDGTTRSAIWNSFILGIGSATVIAVLGFLLAYILTKTRAPGRAIIDYLAILPLGLAGTAFAVGIIIVNLQTPARAMGLYATIWILLVAYIGRYIPFGVRTLQVSLLQVSDELEEASRVGGARQLQTLWYITLPLVKTGITYAWILGFVNAFTEVSASMILAGARNQVTATAVLQLWSGASGLQRACALGVLMFVLTMTLVVIAQRLGGERIVPESADAAPAGARFVTR